LLKSSCHLFLWSNNITTFFPFPAMFYLPCAFICWWCCNLLTSNQDLWSIRDQMYLDGLIHNLPKRFPLYCWNPAAISKIQTGMIMSSLSGFFILAETICEQTLHETCYLI
jgi:hypothetical protein